MGFIAAHDLKNKFKEITVASTNESTHKTKKGFYRIARMPDTDILILGGWLDIHLYNYSNAAFEKIVYLPNLHESSLCSRDLIYSILMYGNFLFTCSDDCTINQIELER